MKVRFLGFTILVFFVALSFSAYGGVKEDFQKAVQLFNEGKVAEALPLFKKVEKKRKKNAEVKYYISLCFHKQKKWGKALNYANKAIELNPNFLKAYAAKGQALIGQKKYEDALNTVQPVLEKNPEHADLLYVKGIALSLLNRYAEAIAPLKKYTEKRPKSAYGHYYLGLAYYETGKKASAVESLKRFLELAPDAPEAPQVRELLKRLGG